jgi:hypothetical protein
MYRRVQVHRKKQPGQELGHVSSNYLRPVTLELGGLLILDVSVCAPGKILNCRQIANALIKSQSGIGKVRVIR